MKRRDFLSVAALATGAFAVKGWASAVSSMDSLTETKPEAQPADGLCFVTEPSKQIPVLANTDVLVVGGGPAGVAAAISAARAGAEVYLVEKANHLGGLWTGGLVLPLLSTHGTGKDGRRIQVIHGLGGEMADRLKDMGMAINTINPVIDPEAGKYLLDKMIADSGVKMLYHSQAADVIMDGDTIRGVFIESKNGRQAVLAKVVIDCTGDGDVYTWAGEKYEKVLCDIGLVHRIGNADRINRKAPGYKSLNVGGATPIKGVRWVNMTGEHNQDGTDMLNLSRLQQKYRIEIWDTMTKMRATPGYEEVFLVDTAPQLGVRASRLLDGEYKLTLDDTLTYKTFDDAIGVCGAWCTLRNLPGGRKIAPKDRPYWQIPYRTLVPKKTDNLLVAGRCTSHERALVEDCRVIGPCLVTGQGAGAAAALAVKNGVRPRDVDTAALRKLLLDQKVWLG